MMGEDHLLNKPGLSHRVMPLILAQPSHYAAVPYYCVMVQFLPHCLHHHFLFSLIFFPYRNVHFAPLLE